MSQPPQFPDWYDLGRPHLWHPYTQMATAPPAIPIERAEGAYLYTSDGRAILDAISSWWVILHGHNHPRLRAAIARQAEHLDQVIFAGFTHEPAARLAAKLAAIAPAGLERVFFSDDGSTAVETALKMAFQYWQLLGETGRTLFVALEGGYHGDTIGAMSVGGVEAFRELFQPLLFKTTRRAHNPTCFRCPAGKERRSCQIECAESLEAVLAENRGKVAAVILEPMLQGAGGMIVWPREFLVKAREACDRHGALLIADEVLTGFGRTGRMFACEHGPVSPDLLCLSKALTGGCLPLAATLASEKIYWAFLGPDRRRAFLHGHSYTANPLACAAALESIALLEEGGLARAREIEAIHQERLESLRALPIAGDVRSIGMVAAVELSPRPGSRGGEGGGYLDEIGPRLHQEFLARGLLLRPLGNVLYFLPPLAITDAELHRVYDAVEEVLRGLDP